MDEQLQLAFAVIVIVLLIVVIGILLTTVIIVYKTILAWTSLFVSWSTDLQ
jgi:hypothetical protein